MIIGIDPGTVNLGLACVSSKGLTEFTTVMNSKEATNVLEFVDELITLCVLKAKSMEGEEKIDAVNIERFVPYAGTFSADSEKIVLLIGALAYGFHDGFDCEVKLLRAIEWKPKLCKDLVRAKAFNNPSTKFDKKFSHAAATHITGKKFKTDHEADAVCLAYYDKI